MLGSDDESVSVTAVAKQLTLLSAKQKAQFQAAANTLALPAGGFWVLAELCAGSIAGAPICSLPSGLLAASFATVSAIANLIAQD